MHLLMQPERMGVLTENHTGRMVFFNKEENFICTVQIFTDWAHVLMVISSAYFEQEKKPEQVIFQIKCCNEVFFWHGFSLRF